MIHPTPDVMILCGGQGTRLRPALNDRPKSLAQVHDRVFMDLLVDQLTDQGMHAVTFCTGYLKERIQEHYASRHDLMVNFSEEQTPLGTGGAVHNALPFIHSDPFVVMNGDSYCDVDFNALLQAHAEHCASVTIVLIPNDAGRQDVGGVTMDSDNTITAFDEKTDTDQTQYINAGIYVFNKSSWQDFSPGAFSLECDTIPKMIKHGAVKGFVVAGPVHDIGTPERYEAFKKLSSKS